MINQKRVLSVQDISCFGKCSNTVALPMLSTAGHECVILPTVLLSTHTGGFTGHTFLDLTGEMEKITAHWAELKIQFDAVQTGYFGSAEQMQMVTDYLARTQSPELRRFVDPVLGDNGKLYRNFTPAHVDAMRAFCAGAHIITPNLTEAALLAGVPYQAQPDAAWLEQCVQGLAALQVERAVLTGVPFEGDQTGAIAVDFASRERQSFHTPRREGYLHGTGDVFASALCAYLLQGKTFFEAVQQTVRFTYAAICATEGMPERYGLCFEAVLPALAPENGGQAARLMQQR